MCPKPAMALFIKSRNASNKIFLAITVFISQRFCWQELKRFDRYTKNIFRNTKQCRCRWLMKGCKKADWRRQLKKILPLVLMMILLTTLSSMPRSKKLVDSPGCRGIEDGRVQTRDLEIQWKNLVDIGDYEKLRSWCQAVGPPVFMKLPGKKSKVPILDTLAIVSWNTHVGGSDLGKLIKDLRSGRLSGGQPLEHFVLLLQEVFRHGPSIPSAVGPDTRSGKSIRPQPPQGMRTDIVETATNHQLELLYVPSMRNGGAGIDAVSEDRGNAILSTLPLSTPIAVELPLERQRRVALAVSISGRLQRGTAWQIQLINVHLENRAKSSNFFRTFGKARLNQIRALLKVIPTSYPTVLGGDFNTWYRQSKEPAVKYVEQFFYRSKFSSKKGTVKFGGTGNERTVDYLFFRIPDSWQGQYQRIDDTYGSDHYPLLGKLSTRVEP